MELESFLENNSMPVTESGCRIWLAGINDSGYGCLHVAGKTLKAHRVSYEIHKGKIPAGLCVLHKCDVRCCIEPSHLFLGTVKENVADMFAKKRHGKRLIFIRHQDAEEIRNLLIELKTVSSASQVRGIDRILELLSRPF